MNRKIFAVAAMMLLAPMMMGAQALKGSYFLDNSLNRNKLNPAFAPRTAYFQIPAIGNLGFGAMSSLKLDTFLYPIDGQLYTFLNKNVTFDEFNANLSKHPYMDINADINLINFGWNYGKGFWTVDMGLRINADFDVPRDLFVFMKKGTGEAGKFNIGNIRGNVAASFQAAVGYSRDLSDLVPGLRVGAKLRAILPAAYIGVDMTDASLTTSAEKWTLDTKGMLYSSVKGLEVMDAEGKLSPEFDPKSLGLAGFGFSFDLGAEYKLEFDGFINGVSVSAAFTDLGIVKYSSGATQTYKTENSMDWTGLAISLEDGKMDEAMDDLKEEFSKFLELTKDGNKAISRSTLPSFYVGAEMPFFNNMMSVGALYSARRSYNYTRNELTLSYNLNPLKWFAFGLNYSFLNAANTLGCILEFTPKVGPCFFVGVDYLPLEWAKAPEGLGLPLLPMSARVNAQFGLSIALGGK